MLWGCISDKGPGEIIISAQVYTQILNTFLSPLVENRFVADEVIKSVKAFLLERHVNSMTWPANTFEHLW